MIDTNDSNQLFSATINFPCIECKLAMFPEPSSQCYRTGGLICQIDHANVGKWDPCRFPDGTPIRNSTQN